MSEIKQERRRLVAPAAWLSGTLAAIALSAPALVQAGPQARSDGSKQALDAVSELFESAAAKVNPSVVPIFSEATVTQRSEGGVEPDPFERLLQGGPERGSRAPRTVQALGSGVITSSDGYILTNDHVVKDAEKVTVVLPDGDRTPARVVGTDPQTDLALVKVDAGKLPAATLGDSDDVKIGEWVIAVGNPFELLHTTTAGIVSATGRSSVGISDYEDFIQTDAAVNPGNSGGALADLDGHVIGINAAISSPTGGSVGVGFAIPINMAKGVMKQLREHGKVTRGYLGVVLQPLTQELAKALDSDETVQGALIGDVERGSPAAAAGIRRGDVVTRFDGRPTADAGALQNLIGGSRPGARVRLGVLRDGATVTLPVTLGEQPQPTETGRRPRTQAVKPDPQRLGLVVRSLTPELAQELGYEAEHGVLVAGVQPGSAAENAGLSRGDLIEEVGRRAVTTPDELAAALHGLASGASAAMLVRREDRTFYVAVEVP